MNTLQKIAALVGKLGIELDDILDNWHKNKLNYGEIDRDFNNKILNHTYKLKKLREFISTQSLNSNFTTEETSFIGRAVVSYPLKSTPAEDKLIHEIAKKCQTILKGEFK